MGVGTVEQEKTINSKQCTNEGRKCNRKDPKALTIHLFN